MAFYRLYEKGRYTKIFQVEAKSEIAALKEYEKVKSNRVIKIGIKTSLEEIAVEPIDKEGE